MARIDSLTQAEVQAALKKHLAGVQWVEMKAGDLEGKAEATNDAAPEASTTETGLPERLARFDANGDGKLQKSEAPERMQQFFGRMDKNGDGAVDADEAAAMRGGRTSGGRSNRGGGS